MFTACVQEGRWAASNNSEDRPVDLILPELLDWLSTLALTRPLNLYFFLVGGKGGNASCTVAPEGAVCGTPVRLADGPFRPLDNRAA